MDKSLVSFLGLLILIILVAISLIVDINDYGSKVQLNFYLVEPKCDDNMSYITCGEMGKKYFKDYLGSKLSYKYFNVIPIAYASITVNRKDLNYEFIKHLCIDLGNTLNQGE